MCEACLALAGLFTLFMPRLYLFPAIKLGMSVSDSWVHLQSFLVQNFVYFFKIRSNFKKIVQKFELKTVKSTSKDHQFAPLNKVYECSPQNIWSGTRTCLSYQVVLPLDRFLLFVMVHLARYLVEKQTRNGTK